MVALIRFSRSRLPIRLKAQQLIAHLRQKNFWGEIKAIHEFVRDKIRYTKDVRDVETLIYPEKLLELGQGDCDDKTMLTASLLESIGHHTRIVAVGRNGQFCHVLLEVRYNNRWIPVETTEPVALGWYPPGMHNRMVYNV